MTVMKIITTIVLLGFLCGIAIQARAQCPTVSSVNLYMPDNCSNTPKEIQVVTVVMGAWYQALKDGRVYGQPRQVVSGDRSQLLTIVKTTDPGVYTVQAWGASPCNNPIMMNGSVTVPPVDTTPPQLGVLFVDSPTHTPSICQGQAVTLKATSGFKSYQWMRDGVSISGATDIQYSATVAGTYTVRAVTTCNVTSTGGSVSVSVAPAPTKPGALTGPATRCQKSEIVTYTVVPNGQNIKWSLTPASAGIIYATGYSTASVNWSASFSGKATISAQGTNCTLLSAASTLDVTVAPTDGILNSLGGPEAVCQGVEVSGFTVIASNTNATYEWSIEDAGASTILGLGLTATVNWAPEFTGVATIKVSAKDCNNSIMSQSMTVSVLPAIGNISITSGPVVYCSGSGDSQYTAVAENAARYTWEVSPTLAGKITDAGRITWTTGFTGAAQITVTAYGCDGSTVQANTQVMVSDPPNCHMNYNYVRKIEVAVSGVKDISAADGLAVGYAIKSIGYFDGLGRPMQTVSVQMSPSKKDVVVPIVYDENGRQSRKYLGFVAGNNGWYNENIIDQSGAFTGVAKDFYNNPNDKVADDPKPYGEAIFERSSLQRILKQGAPGETWQPQAGQATDKTVKFGYEFNQANDVLMFTYDVISNQIDVSQLNFYAPNQLYANSTRDEDDHLVITFSDKDGKTIMKRVFSGQGADGTSIFAETYYIYDDLNNLVVVLPPEGVQAFKAILGN